MKKKLLSMALSFATLVSLNVAKAQKNFNFESWSGTPESADNWSDLNVLTKLGYVKDTSVVKVAGQSGFAAQLQPVSLKALNPAYGNIRTSVMSYKDSSTVRPDTASFYYKFKPDTNATPTITFAFTAWNTTTNHRDTVAKAKFLPTPKDTVKTFTLKKLPLTYVVNKTKPDTLAITLGLVAKDSTGKATRLVIDEIKLLGVHKDPSFQGIVNSNANAGITVYPGIASTAVNFNFVNTSNLVNIAVYDITGRKVKAVTNNADKYSLNIAEFNDGCYIYKISDLNNNELKTGKFVVNHQ